MNRNSTYFFAPLTQSIHAALFSQQNRWFLPLFSEITVTNLTHFGVLAVLAVYLAENLHFSGVDTALVLACASIGLRGSRIILAPFIGRIPPRLLIPGAIMMSMVGYVGLIGVRTPALAAFYMLLVGTGYGLNSMLVTTLASYTTRTSKSAYPMYALMHTGVNIAAAIAPVMYNMMRLHAAPQAPFICSALILCVSLAVSLRIYSDHDMPPIGQKIQFGKAAWFLLATPRYWIVLSLIAISWAIYTQKFASTPLFISQVLNRPQYVGLAVTLNALIGLMISLPISSFMRFHALSGWRVLACCFLLYAAGYGTLALFPTLPGLWSGLVLWSIGEAILMPQLNTLVAHYTEDEHRLAGFSLAAAAIGIGEASGNAAGIGLATLSIAFGSAYLCYGILAAASIMAALAACMALKYNWK